MDAMKAAENMPLYWFNILEFAREKNDFHKSANAIDRLKSLGVFVKFVNDKHDFKKCPFCERKLPN